MSSDSLGRAMQAWFERTLAGESIDPRAFALEHAVPVDEFLASLADANWLVGRQRAAARDAPSPPFTLGDVDVLAEAGRGAMGVVFRGVQRSLQRPVAVKVMHPELADNRRSMARFAQEARAAGRLRHPNIVSVLFVAEADGNAYLVMDWIEGESLAAILDRLRLHREHAGRNRHHATARLIARVARALQHAHEQGLVHRDVKPGNILVDTHGEPHLADFGLVQDQSAATMTGAGECVGTPAYMSPEQIQGGRVGPRSDVYSLGVTLYECLTSARAFDGSGIENIQQRILEGRFAAPRAIAPDVPRELEAICLTAMALEPGVRYPSAAAFAADLEAFARGEPVTARPPSAWRRLRRLVGTHRQAAVVTGTVAAAAAVVTLGWMHFSNRLAERSLWDAWRDVGEALVRGHAEAIEHAFADAGEHAGLRVLHALHGLSRGDVDLARSDLAAARALADSELEPAVEAALATVDVAGTPPADRSSHALAAVRALAARKPRLPERDLLAGAMLCQLGQWAEAAASLVAARQTEPGLAAAAGSMLVDCRVRLGDWRSARDEARLLGLSCGSPRSLADAVRFMAFAGDVDAARRDAAELGTRYADSAWSAFAELLLTPARAADPTELDRIRRRAESAADDWPAARRVFCQVLADRYRNLGDPASAVRIWQDLVASEPNRPSTRGLLGTALLQLAARRGDPEIRQRGLDELRRAAEIGSAVPFERDVHWGTYWYYAGEPERAAECYRTSVRVCATDPSRWRQLAGACLAAAHRCGDAAARIEWLREGLAAQRQNVALSTDDVMAWGLLGVQLRQLLAALPAADAEIEDLERERDDVEAQVRLLERRAAAPAASGKPDGSR